MTLAKSMTVLETTDDLFASVMGTNRGSKRSPLASVTPLYLKSLVGSFDALATPGLHFVSSSDGFYSQIIMDILAHACALDGRKVILSDPKRISKDEWYGEHRHEPGYP